MMLSDTIVPVTQADSVVNRLHADVQDSTVSSNGTHACYAVTKGHRFTLLGGRIEQNSGGWDFRGLGIIVDNVTCQLEEFSATSDYKWFSARAVPLEYGAALYVDIVSYSSPGVLRCQLAYVDEVIGDTPIED